MVAMGFCYELNLAHTCNKSFLLEGFPQFVQDYANTEV